jgi:hypothetical protein
MAGFLDIHRDSATPEIRRLKRKLGPAQRQGFVLAWARQVANLARKSARDNGGRRFWKEVADSVQSGLHGFAGKVWCADPAGIHAHTGGPIRRKNKRALTIPIPGSGAEGKTAAEFSAAGIRLFSINSAGGDADSRGVLGYSRGGEFVALFALRTKTRPQRPRPWWPDDAEALNIGDRMAKRKLGVA